jgi:predicted metal-binding protein
MEKILIVGCQSTMDNVCIACSRCMVGFNKRNGEFARYDKDAELIGILSCGGCPGVGIVTRLAQIACWNAQNGEKPTKIHIAPCLLDHCPEKETIIKKIKAKTAIEVIEGTHTYKPENLFA